MTTFDLVEAGRELAKADRRFKNAKAALDHAWNRGDGTAALVQAHLAAQEAREAAIDSMLLVLGTMLLERDRREQANTETSPLKWA